jgi:hypothetical protein
VISKPSGATTVETHYEIDIATIEVFMIIQIQVVKNIVEDVLIDGRASVNIITENFKTKLDLPKPILVPYHLKMVDQNMRIHHKFEDSYTWYTICSHIYCFEKQCGGF